MGRADLPLSPVRVGGRLLRDISPRGAGGEETGAVRRVVRFLLICLMFAMLGAACGGGSEPAEPELVPVPGLVVFTRGVDIWIHDEDGERLLIEAAEDQQLLSPALDPEGRRIAFVIFQLTSGEGFQVGASLALYDPGGDAANPLKLLLRHEQAGEYHWNPRWSPDGEALIYSHEAPDLDIRIEMLDLSSGRATVLRDRARSGDLSPDGERLAFIADPYGGDPRLAVRELGTGEETVLDPAGAWEPRPYRIPRWTPNGDGIVFSAGQALPTISAAPILTGAGNGPEDIWHVDLASGQLTLLAAVGEDQPDFAISSDGRHVLILGAFGLYLAAIPPTEPPYAFAPGEFHGGIDWIGALSEDDVQRIRDSVLTGASE